MDLNVDFLGLLSNKVYTFVTNDRESTAEIEDRLPEVIVAANGPQFNSYKFRVMTLRLCPPK